MRWSDRRLWASYVDGVIDQVNGGALSTGMLTEARDAQAIMDAESQGFWDARDGRVLRRYEFSREVVLRRAEVRKAP